MEWRFISPWALVVARPPYQANDNSHDVLLRDFTPWMHGGLHGGGGWILKEVVLL